MTVPNRILFDTSALIELFLGSTAGDQVRELFADENVENFVPTLVLAEIISKLKRSNADPAQIINTIERNAIILEFSSDDAKKAGYLHATLKKEEPGISLVDCILMIHTDNEGAIIITTDKHFKLYKNSKIV